MNMLFKALDTNALVGQHVTTDLDNMLVGNVIDNYIVGTDFQRFRHQVVGRERAFETMTVQMTIYKGE
jgi:hypothetical protein